MPKSPRKAKKLTEATCVRSVCTTGGTTIRWCIAASTIKTRRKCSHAWRKPMAALRACSSAIRARAAVCHWRSATISSPSSWRTPDLSAALVWCCLPVPARTRGNDCTPMPTHTAHPHRDRHRVDDHAASVLPHGHQHGRVPCVGPAIATDFERWYVNHNYKLRLCHSAEHQPYRGRLN